jgi:hypothetical protein
MSRLSESSLTTITSPPRLLTIWPRLFRVFNPFSYHGLLPRFILLLYLCLGLRRNVFVRSLFPGRVFGDFPP